MKARLRWRWLLLLGSAIGLNYLAARWPAWTEAIYARGIYPPFAQALSRFTRVAPFSLTELAVVLAIIALPVLIIRWLITSWRSPANWLLWPWRLLALIGTLYAIFVMAWGLNYYRLPLATISQLPVQPSTATELTDLCQSLLMRANALRQALPEDSSGVMQLTGGKWRALARAHLGYQQAAKGLAAIGGNYGSPKGVYLSEPWSYTGIAGMYSPFTGEANVNMAIPDPFIPAIASHEMAHQRGFAREDEANYLAYLTCSQHPDAEFRYSGALLALTMATRSLRAQDEAAFMTLRQGYSAGLVRDLIDYQEFWQRHSGTLERISEQINDRYLKTQGQADGTQSYGRMVDLLLAEQRLGNR